MKPLPSSQKKKIINLLNNQFGISKIPHLFLKFGKEKLRLYSGDFSKEELIELDNNLKIESIGLYFAKIQNDGIRLSLDGTILLKSQISKNILDLSDKQSKDWFKGEDLNLKLDKNFKILRNKNDIIGTGKSTGEKITNSMPKERRIKN